MIETKESDWWGIGKFKYLICKKPVWVNFIPIRVKVKLEVKNGEKENNKKGLCGDYDSIL